MKDSVLNVLLIFGSKVFFTNFANNKNNFKLKIDEG